MVNKVILIGNLGADPELRYTQTQKPVAKISVATTKKYNGNETTQWHTVILWEKLAELANSYLKKGSKVYVEGELTYRTYDKQDGSKGYSTEIIGQQMRNLTPRDPASVAGTYSASEPPKVAEPPAPMAQKPVEQARQAPSDYENDFESIPF